MFAKLKTSVDPISGLPSIAVKLLAAFLLAEVVLSENKPLSRSEREAQIKDKAGWLITVLAALLAINTYVASGNSSKVLNNTISANNTWAFYQAKSVKQTLAEMARDDAIERKQFDKAEKLTAKIDRYESEPATGEGKKELMAKAKGLEAERDQYFNNWFDNFRFCNSGLNFTF